MEALRLARAWLDHHKFPSEIRALPRAERAFIWAAQAASDQVNEEAKKPKPPPPGSGPAFRDAIRK